MMSAPARRVAYFSLSHIAFILPIILLHLGCSLVLVAGVSEPALVVFLASSAIQLFGITTGYHRLIAHRSFKTSRQFQFALACFGVLAGQNGPLWWVSHHRHHHRHSDRQEDIHSPNRGLFWSHMGWLFSPKCVHVRLEFVTDLSRVPELVWLERHSFIINLSYAVLLYLCGEAWHACFLHSSVDGFQFVIWGSALSKVCVYHAVWSANSICHRYGRCQYKSGDNSRNNFLVALFTLGDGWHHNHHYCPRSARHGFRWWEVDINFAILSLLSYLGIVWDLRVPHELRRGFDRGR
jgi:stearoyl-CoA desaturase (delta-9 desaturase)